MTQRIYQETRWFPPEAAVPREYRDRVGRLFATWSSVAGRNRVLADYYHMHNAIRPLGISVPSEIERKLSPVCGWAAKAVRVRNERQVFEGYVSTDGGKDPTLDRLFRENGMSAMQARANVSKLVYGMAAYTVMRGGPGQPSVKVRSYSATQCAAIWDKDAGRIACGVVLADVDTDGEPSRYVAHFPDAVLDISRSGTTWSCDVAEHGMGRPLMEVITHDADHDRPLGHSALTPEITDIIDTSLRDLARMEIAYEFFTFPQRYILGASEGLFMGGDGEDGESEANEPLNKLRAYVGAILAITKDEDGDLPQVGQFSPSDPKAFTTAYEMAAQRFSGASNVPLGQLGVLSNTYTSSDALSATNDPLILEVEAGNRADAKSLEDIGRMMLAIDGKTTLDGVGERGGIQAAFRDPSMPTLSSRADAWTKLAAVDAGIAGTRVFYEGIGLSQAMIDRLLAEKQRASSTELLRQIAMSQGVGDV